MNRELSCEFLYYLGFIHCASKYLAKRGCDFVILARSPLCHHQKILLAVGMVGSATVELLRLKSLFEGYRKYPFRKEQLYSCIPTIHPERGYVL